MADNEVLDFFDPDLDINSQERTSESEQIFVLKRDGTKEPLQLKKIHRVLEWATEGLSGVSYSTIEIKAKIQFKQEIKTKDIHKILCKTAADLISEEQPNYQYVAARLAIFSLRKEVFGQINPPHLYKHVTKMVESGHYTKELLEWYTEEDFDRMNNFINHNRDYSLVWTAYKQMEGKYLVQDRTNKQIYETPQFLYILVAATLFHSYPKEKRLMYIEKYYNVISTQEVSLPTPIMAGVRTPVKQFSSCVLIEAEDSLDSINAVSSSIIKYISQKAGIGINAGAIRGLGSPIRGGNAVHTGVIPFYKHFQTAVKSCSQGGVRGGSATLFAPIWHLEIENILVLKNNKGTEDNRVRHLDYGIQFNKYLYERMLKNQKVTLFSTHDTKDLYAAFFADQDKFKELYEKYEQDPKIIKKQINGMELLSLFMQERASTGRIYFQNVDLCNEYGPFIPEKAPIRQSNLCLEIALPTKPLVNSKTDEGEIALCTLSAFNLGKIPVFDFNNKEESKEVLREFFEERAEVAVRALDALLDYQEYPVKQAEVSTMLYRNLGMGVINYAYTLAKHGVQYSNDTALKLTHILTEAIQFYCMKASIKLAKEKGKCLGFENTKYSYGSLPIDADRHKKAVDDLLEKHDALFYLQDWEGLRKDLKKYGIRNATLTAFMPSETSSQIANATNGIEPPRDFISYKLSKDGVMKQVVPEIENETIKWNYELLWDQQSPKGYINLVGVMQKFVDQAISGNTSYNPNFFPERKIPMSVLLQDFLYAFKMGWKTGYYHNTNDQSTEDDDCETCKI